MDEVESKEAEEHLLDVDLMILSLGMLGMIERSSSHLLLVLAM